MSQILITGGSGFIGTNLVQDGLDRGHQVLNLDRVAPRNPAHGSNWTYCDLTDFPALRKLVQRFEPEVILHMGARTDLDGRSVTDYAANTVGVRNLIEASRGLPRLRRVIFASSRLVCRIGFDPASDEEYCPTTAYGASKVEGERIVRACADRLQCSWGIVRPTSIWGPWFDIPYKSFFSAVAKGLYVHPRGERIAKSFGFVGNTVHEVNRLLEAGEELVHGRVFYLADYPPVDVLHMAKLIRNAFSAPKVREVDYRLLRALALAGDVLKRFGWSNPPLTSFRLTNLMTPMVHDLRALQAIVGDLPFGVEEGVALTAAWLRDQGQV
jgi:nucleoside-diphosphate-sugar epimerase